MKLHSKSHYGPFFWLATVSFVMPLIVAGAAFQQIRPTTKPDPRPDSSGVDHALWDYLLKSFVSDGLVDYGGIRRDHLFHMYLGQLGQARPERLATEGERLALLCNAYNAFVVNGVITHGISGSVMDYTSEGKQFFDLREHIFAGRTISLNMIEHEMIRSRFHEPRVHMALVCAARSCPALRPEAYIGPRIAAQLEDQAWLFANNPRYVDYDQGHDILRLSPILKWYGEDWKNEGGYLSWLRERIQDEATAAALARAMQGDLRIEFADYDWSLNGRAGGSGRAATEAGQSDFGSGTVPNR